MWADVGLGIIAFGCLVSVFTLFISGPTKYSRFKRRGAALTPQPKQPEEGTNVTASKR